MEILKTKSKYYYEGKLKKGIKLDTEPRQGTSVIELPAFTVIKKDDRYFLLNEPELISKGLKVESELFEGVGIVIEKGETLSLVEINGNKKLYKDSDLIESKSNLERNIKAFNIYNNIKGQIDKTIENENIEFAKSFFDVYKAMDLKDEEPDINISKPMKMPKAQSVGDKIIGKVKGVLGMDKPTPNRDANLNLDGIKKKSGLLFGLKDTLIEKTGFAPRVKNLETGQSYSLNSSKERPSAVPVLSHISLNKDAKGQLDKLNYHYKIGNNPNAIVNNLPIDHNRNEVHPQEYQHPALMSKKILLPGETVEHQGKDYKVHSHIDPVPKDEQGNVDYANALIKDEKNNLYSVNRDKLIHKGPDFLTAQKVGDSGKFHHQLKAGDTFMHNGEQHRVVFANKKGHLTSKGKIGTGADVKQYYTFAEDYDKPYKHNEFKTIPDKADKGDVIKFNHLGAQKYREVLDTTPEGVVVKVNKSEKPILVKHGKYEHTGEKAHEIYQTKDNIIHTSKNTEEGKPKEIDNDYIKNAEITEEVPNGLNNEFQNHLEKMDKHGERTKIDDKTYHHDLGFGGPNGNVTVESKEGEEPKILNPFFKMGNYTHEITGFDPDSGKIRYRTYDKNNIAKLNSKGDIKETPMDIKAITGSKMLRSGPPKKGTEDDAYTQLQSNLAKTIKKHNVTDTDQLTMASGDLENELKEHIDRYNKKFNSDMRGTGLVPNKFEKAKHNSEDVIGALDEIGKKHGKDWKTDVFKAVEDMRTTEEKAKKNEELMDSVKQRQQEIKKTLSKTAKNYKEYTENNEPKKHIVGKPTEIYTKHEDFNKTPAHFAIVDTDDPENGIVTSHIAGMDKNKPFEKTTADYFDGQNRTGYHEQNAAGQKARQDTIDIAKNWDSKRAFNPYNQEGDTGTPVLDPHHRTISGNGRNMAYMIASQDKVEEARKHLKDNIDSIVDIKDDEQRKNLLDQIDKMKRPSLQRVLEKQYHENPEWMDALGGQLNIPSTKVLSATEEGRGLEKLLGNEGMSEFHNIMGDSTPQGFKNSPDKVKKYFDLQRKYNPEGYTKYFIDNKDKNTLELTGSGLDQVKALHSNSYFDDPAIHKKIADTGIGPVIRGKISDSMSALNGLKNTTGNIKKELHNAIINIADDKKSKGTGSLIKQTIPEQVISHILRVVSPEETQKIFEDYHKAAKDYDQNIDQYNIFGGETPEQFKENYFKRLASKINTKENPFKLESDTDTKPSIPLYEEKPKPKETKKSEVKPPSLYEEKPKPKETKKPKVKSPSLFEENKKSFDEDIFKAPLAGENAIGFKDALNKNKVYSGLYDDKPKFEISDDKAKLKDIELLKIKPSKSNRVKYQDDSGDTYFSNAHIAGKSIKLPKILDHEELYKNYPHFKDMDVHTYEEPLDKNNTIKNAYYHPFCPDKLFINVHPDMDKIKNKDEKIDNILHEVQHSIQDREKWYPEEMDKYTNNIDHEQEYHSNRRKYLDGLIAMDIQNFKETHPSLPNENIKKFKDASPTSQVHNIPINDYHFEMAKIPFKEMSKKLGTIKELIDYHNKKRDTYANYKNQPHEREARLTEQRRTLTPEERISLPHPMLNRNIFKQDDK